MRTCILCGADSTSTRIIKSKQYGMLCDKCYQRERLNPVRYEKPGYGEVTYSPEGKPICHVCGKAYDKVLSHVWQIHDMTEEEYKEEFGLDATKGIMSEKSTQLARKRVFENYEVSVEQNLLEKGEDTRFEDGHEGRRADKVREQTRRVLISRIAKIGIGRNKDKDSSEK